MANNDGILQENIKCAGEGETKNYSESYRYNELAIIETTDPKFDDVVVTQRKRRDKLSCSIRSFLSAS